MADGTPTGVDDSGNEPDVSETTLEPENRVITSASQAYSVCERLVYDCQKRINNAARITAKINGDRPRPTGKLKNQGESWKSNISTGFLGTECGKVPPRFYMPVKTAKYLTAAQLPTGWPDGVSKSEYFRTVITETIRSWPKWNFFIRGLAREVGVYGYGFPTYFDKYEWRPSLIRMDKGFVPQGTEVMDNDFPFYCVKWDYQPGELLELLKKNQSAGLGDWKKDNVVNAINNASFGDNIAEISQARTYEDLIRQAALYFTYTKGVKIIETYHLFALEYTGKVSHFVILRNSNTKTTDGATLDDSMLLYQKLDAYDSMADVCIPMVFDYGDGTIHGAWGAGQILYDMAVQVEYVRNDSIDNLKNQNKLKIEVAEAKDVAQVKLTVTSTLMIVSGGKFAGSTAAIPQNIDGYIVLDQQMTRLAQEKIGSYLPPIPSQPSDIKAAQVNASIAKEQEIQQALLDNWLAQVARLIEAMTRRMTNVDSPDPVAKRCREKLLKVLSPEEITLLVDQPTLQTITDFTPFAAQQRAAFAAAKAGNPLYNQRNLEVVQSESAGGVQFSEYVLLPAEDQSVVLTAQRQQIMENSALIDGQDVPVLPIDNDWVHMQELQPKIEMALQSKKLIPAQTALKHFSAHYVAAVQKKTMPKEAINPTKSWIAKAQQAIEAITKELQSQQQLQQMAQQAVQGIPGQVQPGAGQPAPQAMQGIPQGVAQ